jgi:cyclohexanone monooxygenase
MQEVLERQARLFENTVEAEQQWVQTVVSASVMSLDFLESCTPGYYNNEGQPNGELVRRNGSFAPGIMAFSKILDDWRESGELQGLTLS